MAIEIQKLLKEVAPCQKCSGLKPWRKFPIGTNGNLNTKAMLIGEAPSENSLKQRKFWVGPNGQRVRKILSKCDSIGNETLEDIFYLTDIVKCCPPNKRKPEPEEICNCKHYLKQEIAILDPKYILVFGKTSFDYFLDNYKPKITVEFFTMGEIQNDQCYNIIKFGKFYLIPLLHAINRSMNSDLYEQQLKEVFEFVMKGRSVSQGNIVSKELINQIKFRDLESFIQLLKNYLNSPLIDSYDQDTINDAVISAQNGKYINGLKILYPNLERITRKKLKVMGEMIYKDWGKNVNSLSKNRIIQLGFTRNVVWNRNRLLHGEIIMEKYESFQQAIQFLIQLLSSESKNVNYIKRN
jgi:uracil-DNA glycosylase family 4